MWRLVTTLLLLSNKHWRPCSTELDSLEQSGADKLLVVELRHGRYDSHSHLVQREDEVPVGDNRNGMGVRPTDSDSS